MSIMHNPDSTYSRELSRWDLSKREGGFGADGFEPFPTMLYKAFPNSQGTVMCGDPRAAMGDADAETFSRKCQLFIKGQEDMERALKAGWSDTPDAALVRYESDQRSVADTAAARHFSECVGPVRGADGRCVNARACGGCPGASEARASHETERDDAGGDQWHRLIRPTTGRQLSPSRTP